MSSTFLSLLIVGFLGIFISIATFKNPRLFWPFLIIISVGTGGLFVGGYSLLDEFLLGFLVLGSLFSLFLVKEFSKQEIEKNRIDSWHLWIFYSLIFYMIFQALRGLFLGSEDLIKISRWIIYYLILGLLAFILSRKPFAYFNKKEANIIICATAVFYLLAYLFHGTLSEIFREVNRYALQGVEWSGTSSATFPLLISSASAIFLIRDRDFLYRLFGVSLLILAIIVSIYYDSRSSLLAVSIFIFLLPFLFKIPRTKKIILFVMIILIVVPLMWSIAGQNFKDYYRVLFQGEKKYEVWHRQGGDIDRYLYFQAARKAVNENWKTFLFGYGMYSHRSVMVPFFQELADRYRLGILVEKPFRTEAFEVLLVDSGWFGILLFLTNLFILLWLILFQNKNPDRLILLPVVFLIFFWFGRCCFFLAFL